MDAKTAITRQRVTKLQAAQRQIDAAIIMFLRGDDPLAVHTVVSAGSEIINDLAEKQNTETSIQIILKAVKEEKKKDALHLLRSPQNFLKHAKKDPDGVLEYNPELVEHHLLLACNGYSELTKRTTPEMSAYTMWFSLIHPSILELPQIKEAADNYIKAWGQPSSIPDKELILRVIENHKQTSQSK